MAIGDLQGRGHTSIHRPSALGECDRCRVWYQLDRLQRQYEWRGVALADTGYLVCPSCLDVPQEQLRSIIFPGDPIPRGNPRPSPDITGPATFGSVAVPTNPGNYGFSQYVLGAPSPGAYPSDAPPNPGPNLTDEFNQPSFTTEDGREVNLSLLAAGAYTDSRANVLAAVALLSGVPTPTGLYDRTVVTLQNLAVSVLADNPARSWVLLYNPSAPVVQMALASSAVLGMTTNLSVGPGEAYFWATAQGLGAAYTGPVAIIGLYPGVQFWAWEAA